jgi:hypothetical protein
VRTQSEIDSIIRDVQARLDVKRQANGLALHVPPDGYLQDEDWLSVIVEPDVPGVRAYDYVDALGALERDLRKSGIEKVVLVPALAD